MSEGKILRSFSYTERTTKAADPEVEKQNMKSAYGLNPDEELNTHFIFKQDKDGFTIIGDDNGLPLTFPCRRMAEEAITDKKTEGSMYHIVSLVQTIG